jgi:hypothetical protein
MEHNLPRSAWSTIFSGITCVLSNSWAIAIRTAHSLVLKDG